MFRAFLTCLFAVVLGGLIGSIIGIVPIVLGITVEGLAGLCFFFVGVIVAILGVPVGAFAGARFWFRRTQSPVGRRQAVVALVLGGFFVSLFLALCVFFAMQPTTAGPHSGFFGDL